MGTAHDETFEQVYQACFDRVFGYCLRHEGRNGAEDVVAEVFSIAWRRRADLPDPALPWLIVTARNVMSGQRRRRRRDDEVIDRLVPLSELVGSSPEVDVVRRTEIIAALETLNEDDREAILLVAWDGLTVREAARVLGCTPGALRVRIHRARKRLDPIRDHERSNR